MRLFILFAGVMFIILGCKTKDSTPTIVQTTNVQKALDTIPDQTDIDVATARQMMNTTKDIILLDVRTKEEVNAGKIETALNFDINQQDFETQLETLDKNKPYIVYCAVGGRSSRAVSYMKANGFNNVYNMLGGYTEWVVTK